MLGTGTESLFGGDEEILRQDPPPHRVLAPERRL